MIGILITISGILFLIVGLIGASIEVYAMISSTTSRLASNRRGAPCSSKVYRRTV